MKTFVTFIGAFALGAVVVYGVGSNLDLWTVPAKVITVPQYVYLGPPAEPCSKPPVAKLAKPKPVKAKQKPKAKAKVKARVKVEVKVKAKAKYSEYGDREIKLPEIPQAP